MKALPECIGFLIKRFIVFITMIVFVFPLFAGTTTKKLSKLSEFLIKEYRVKIGNEKSIIAIFPFNTDERLSKQRVGFAISEMMSHKFISSDIFIVAERTELGRLITEQKLQVSGAVENETAVKLGKILAAKIILIGNVQKVAGKYQINARLVNVETSEVLTSGYEELSVESFNKTALLYLNLVPEEQTIGIYFSYNSSFP